MLEIYWKHLIFAFYFVTKYTFSLSFCWLLSKHIQERILQLREAFRVIIESYRDLYDFCKAQATKLTPQEPIGSREHRKAFAIAVQSQKAGWIAPMMMQYQGRCTGLQDFFESKRQIDGSWSNSFLDSILHRLSPCKNNYVI